MQGEPLDDDESEIVYEFMIDEPDDITLVMMPKLEFDLEEYLESYYKQIKKCRNKDQIKSVLRNFYALSSGVATLQTEIDYLQSRAKELEMSIKMMQQYG